MKCAKCGGAGDVVDSRASMPSGHSSVTVRRRRVCSGCKRKWTTYEMDAREVEELMERAKALDTIRDALSRQT